MVSLSRVACDQESVDNYELKNQYHETKEKQWI